MNFNPRAPRGARQASSGWKRLHRYFNPRAPRGARRGATLQQTRHLRYFNPRAPRGARLCSPHRPSANSNFNPRAPRGARPRAKRGAPLSHAFQSTCPARGTTVTDLISDLRKIISIHVPREGHDNLSQPPFFYNYIFQSTCPARGTTAHRLNLSESKVHFNPRAPRGARQNALKIRNTRTKFQSTCPARGTTAAAFFSATATTFQSTCPARGTTDALSPTLELLCNFNPRAPRGARHYINAVGGDKMNISIHVPREGHDELRGLYSPAN